MNILFQFLYCLLHVYAGGHEVVYDVISFHITTPLTHHCHHVCLSLSCHYPHAPSPNCSTPPQVLVCSAPSTTHIPCQSPDDIRDIRKEELMIERQAFLDFSKCSLFLYMLI